MPLQEVKNTPQQTFDMFVKEMKSKEHGYEVHRTLSNLANNKTVALKQIGILTYVITAKRDLSGLPVFEGLDVDQVEYDRLKNENEVLKVEIDTLTESPST